MVETEQLNDYARKLTKSRSSRRYSRCNIRGAQPDPDPMPTYSYAGPPVGNIINYEGDSEFLQLVNGRDQNEILPVVDKLMTTLQVINSRLYNSVIRKL